jgi:hypothetical protein
MSFKKFKFFPFNGINFAGQYSLDSPPHNSPFFINKLMKIQNKLNQICVKYVFREVEKHTLKTWNIKNY